MVTAVFIVSHGIMGRIQQEFADMGLREELEHGEIIVQKAMGIMPGSRSQKRKDREVILRIRGREYVEVIAEIVTVPVRIPAHVAIGLMVDTIAFAVTDAFFQAITGAGFPFTRPGINRGPVTGECEVLQIDQSLRNGFIQEQGTEDLKETPGRSEILRRFEFKSVQEVIDGHFFNGIRFLPFLRWFLRFSLWRMDGVGEVVIFREPKPPDKVVESPDTGGIADREARKDGVKKVLLEGRSPGSQGRDLELHGKQIGAQHIRRKARRRTEHRILILHELVDRGKVKVPEQFHDFPCSRVKRSIRIRIIFTKLIQDTVLIGGMAARINRFQKKRTPHSKSVFRLGRTNCLVKQGARSAAFLERFVNSFFEKSGGIYKKGISEAA